MQASFNWWLWGAAMFMSIPVAVMAHNINHVKLWKSDALNLATDYWLTLFYGFPAFAWIPTHNRNHHALNNREGDYTITWRYSEGNNLLTLVTYPSISGWFQQQAIRKFIAYNWQRDRKRAMFYLSQYVVLITFYAVALIIDWKKALLFIVAPHQLSLYAVLIFNYVQHVHADEESKYNHSRNFLGVFLNTYLFNNGYHTVHHINPNTHWSETPREHAKIAHLIDPVLNERGFWTYIIRNYILGAVIPKFRTHSMRLDRIARQRAAAGETTTATA
jgi:fatty acid desaturase